MEELGLQTQAFSSTDYSFDHFSVQPLLRLLLKPLCVHIVKLNQVNTAAHRCYFQSSHILESVNFILYVKSQLICVIPSVYEDMGWRKVRDC